MDADLDLVLVGATGFVGRLTAAHLAAAAPERLRIGLAGRSLEALGALRESLPGAAAQWPLLRVDVTDPAQARDLAARTSALATTVGPYAVRGLPLARACAHTGTHYADLTAEILFAHETVRELHDVATASGARVVHSCGFDSVPSDLGVWLTVRQAAKDAAGGLSRTVLTVRDLRGGISGGTVDSLRQQVLAARSDPRARALLADRDALLGVRAARPGGPSGAGGSADRRTAGRPLRREPSSGHWTVPFFMGAYNVPLVRRSHSLAGPHGYGSGFSYRERLDVGPGPAGAVRGAAVLGALGAVGTGLGHRPTRAVLDRLLPAPGEGPGEERRRRGRFRLEVEAGTEHGASYLTTVAAELDPGYEGTAVMFGQAALALASGETTERVGVLTPATAFGPFLVDRLRSHGFTLTTERVGTATTQGG